MPKASFKKEYDVVYSFRVSRVAEGNFKNLWRLEIATPNEPTLTEIVDADSLSTVMGKMQYIFERDGF